MKKIGILNFHYSNQNYGAVLQAAALQHYFKSNAINAEIIDYVPIKCLPKSLKNGLKWVASALGLISILKRLINKDDIIRHDVANSSVFEDFRTQWLSRGPRFNYIKELYTHEFNYDIVIVGSDQVWRPKVFTNFIDYHVYFLDFIPDNIMRVSYAASFGVDEWEISNDTINSHIRDMMKKFFAISVREESGVKICHDTFALNAHHVIDPTLLVGKDFFNEVINDTKEQVESADGIVYYKLDTNDTFIKNINKLSAYQNGTAKNIYYNKHVDGYSYFSVASWLNQIKTSQIVITDSFHCICLSLLFHKEFICCINTERGLSRLQSLFSLLGIKGRICSVEDDFVSLINEMKPIDYTVVDRVLHHERKKAAAFINDFLNKVERKNSFE